MSFIAGPYTVTYNALALGIMQDAPSIEITSAADEIIGDNLGDTVQDGVYRGGNCFVDLVLQEFDAAGAAGAFAPFADWGKVGQPGKLLSSFAKALVFTAVAGTTSTPATVTANKAILAPGFPVRMLYGTRLKNVPLRFQLLPNGSPEEWFS